MNQSDRKLSNYLKYLNYFLLVALVLGIFIFLFLYTTRQEAIFGSSPEEEKIEELEKKSDDYPFVEVKDKDLDLEVDADLEKGPSKEEKYVDKVLQQLHKNQRKEEPGTKQVVVFEVKGIEHHKVMGEWSDWSECSTLECGVSGEQKRHRKCISGACEEYDTEQEERECFAKCLS